LQAKEKQTIEAVSSIVEKQRAFYETGATRPLSFRRRALDLLRKAIVGGEAEILQALAADLNKSAYEGYLTEIGQVLDEIRFARRRLRRWATPKRVPTPLLHWPAASLIYPEPLGVSLVIAPWNYPFQLAVAPLVAAVAAGNCVVVKPSEFSSHTASALAGIVGRAFDPAHVAVVEGDAEVSKALLDERFDKIFFTGSTRVGKIVMTAAARQLTPVTLELGGKSPCIVAADAELTTAARRIAWGKFLNAGQTCVAPDYLLVHESVIEPLIEATKASIKAFFGENPRQSPDYPRIINEDHFERLTGLLRSGRIRMGGVSETEERYIAPTLIDRVRWDDPIMEEEIFGPLLPVLSFSNLDEAVEAVNKRPKPLALYYFGRNAGDRQKVIEEAVFGGGCVNDVLLHLATPHLPFGGIGQSGMGSYHGKAGFDAFSHFKSILKRTAFPDAPLRYPPFSQWKMRLIKLLLR